MKRGDRVIVVTVFQTKKMATERYADIVSVNGGHITAKIDGVEDVVTFSKKTKTNEAGDMYLKSLYEND